MGSVPRAARVAAPQLTDPRLLVRVRDLIRREHAGFVDGRCLEPGCSCEADTGLGDPDPSCGPLRDPPARCTSFEQAVLPLDPDLEAAYWAHLRTGALLVAQRCEWDGARPCRRQAVLGYLFCRPHLTLALRRGLAVRGGQVPAESTEIPARKSSQQSQTQQLTL